MEGEAVYRIAVCAHSQPLVAYAVEAILSDYQVHQCRPGQPSLPAVEADLVFQYAPSTHCALNCPHCCGMPIHAPRVFMSLGWLETEEAVRRAGFRGYLGPSCSPTQIMEAVAAVLMGGSLYHPGTRQIVSVGPLTERQVQVLRLVAMGYTDQEIAIRLGVLPTTVRHHLEALQRKLDLTRRGELIALAALGGLKGDGTASAPKRVGRQTQDHKPDFDGEYGQTAETVAVP